MARFSLPAVLLVLALLGGCTAGDPETVVETVTVTEQAGADAPEPADDVASQEPEPSSSGGEALGTAGPNAAGVVLEVLALERRDAVLEVRFSLHNESASAVVLPVDQVSGARLVTDDVTQRYLVLLDEASYCVCGPAAAPLGPRERTEYYAQFPLAPEDVAEMSVEVPTFVAVNDVPVAPG